MNPHQKLPWRLYPRPGLPGSHFGDVMKLKRQLPAAVMGLLSVIGIRRR
jgi:hypothetical protein